MSEFEYWVRKNGEIAETERNPCNCCPDTYNVTDKRTINCKIRTVFIGYVPRKEFVKYMNGLGYEKLKD